ncbi:MAG: DUF4926 domain-containing protein [Anaerolineae bacterium]|jgi:hypothetical protein|nr:DUF4926 domain-containing protein [Chloroflexota bacterium]MBN8636679.1 DUF4926 domain-containing protein [Anaerolineae bacterium]
MTPELYQRVTINRDIPDEDLKQGDVARVVDYVKHPQGGEDGAVLEVFNALGESLRVVIVPVSAIEALRAEHILSVRVA